MTDDTRKHFYNECYTILVQHAGAHESQRADFVNAFMNTKHPPTEWRFGGDLGFGGKFYRDTRRINNYPEDRTPEHVSIIAKVNNLIAKLSPLPSGRRQRP